ncbi:MAG TPA: biotin/lipoyl-binding protein, partial [Pseudolabrys sp.]
MNQRLASATRIFPWLAVAAIGIAIGWMIAGGGFIRAAATEQTTPTRRDAGVLRFPEGAPQLAALRIEVAETFPLPLAEPLNGRVAYDENRTVRISAPIAGRVISIKSEVGDGVRAGDTLATIDAP